MKFKKLIFFMLCCLSVNQCFPENTQPQPLWLNTLYKLSALLISGTIVIKILSLIGKAADQSAIKLKLEEKQLEHTLKEEQEKKIAADRKAELDNQNKHKIELYLKKLTAKKIVIEETIKGALNEKYQKIITMDLTAYSNKVNTIVADFFTGSIKETARITNDTIQTVSSNPTNKTTYCTNIHCLSGFRSQDLFYIHHKAAQTLKIPIIEIECSDLRIINTLQNILTEALNLINLKENPTKKCIVVFNHIDTLLEDKKNSKNNDNDYIYDAKQEYHEEKQLVLNSIKSSLPEAILQGIIPVFTSERLIQEKEFTETLNSKIEEIQFISRNDVCLYQNDLR